MINQIILAFVVVVGLLFYFMGGGDGSSTLQIKDEKQLTQKQEEVQKPKKEVKIEYKETKTDMPMKHTSQVIDNPINEPKISKKILNEKNSVIVSQTSTKNYKLSLKTDQSTDTKEQLTPPSFPSIIKGEINGEKFSVPVDKSKINTTSTLILSNKAGGEVEIDIKKITDSLTPGQVADVGNVMMPEDEIINEQDSNYIEESINSNVQEEPATFSGPPMPPAIK